MMLSFSIGIQPGHAGPKGPPPVRPAFSKAAQAPKAPPLKPVFKKAAQPPKKGTKSTAITTTGKTNEMLKNLTMSNRKNAKQIRRETITVPPRTPSP
ncbi:MAG: hypothetical protein ACR2P3_03355 [Geminicoccaceae bacterium]